MAVVAVMTHGARGPAGSCATPTPPLQGVLNTRTLCLDQAGRPCHAKHVNESRNLTRREGEGGPVASAGSNCAVIETRERVSAAASHLVNPQRMKRAAVDAAFNYLRPNSIVPAAGRKLAGKAAAPGVPAAAASADAQNQ